MSPKNSRVKLGGRRPAEAGRGSGVREAKDGGWAWPWGALGLVALVFLAYGPALRAGFVWDDDEHFLANPVVSNPRGLVDIWTTTKAMYYPLTLTTWWVLRRLAGFDPLAFHLVTIMFHVGAALLFWRVLLALKIPGAGWGAMLFALHPMQVESVAWATELKNTQSGFFFLLAMLWFLRWEDSRLGRVGAGEDVGEGMARANAGAGWPWLAAAFVAFAAALLSKPAVVALPGVLLVLHVWRRRRLDRAVALGTLPFFVFALGWSAWTIWEQKHHSGALGEEWALTFGDRLVNAGLAAWFYVWKWVWPHPLIFIYPRWNPDAGVWWLWGPLAGWGALLGGSAFAVWKRRGAGAGKDGGAKVGAGGAGHVLAAALVYLGLLFPVLGFFNIYYMRFSFVADHFAYVALLPLSALGGAGFEALRRRLAPGGRPRALWVVAGIALLLAVMTWRQARNYESEASLWEATVACNPSAWIGWNNLGYERARQGQAAEALEMYERALGLKPEYDDALNNSALALMELGRTEEAVRRLKRSVQIRPMFPDALNNLATAHAELDEMDAAIEAMRRAIEIAPGEATYHANLGTLLAREKQFEQALRAYEEALRLAGPTPEYSARIEWLRGR